MTDARLREFQRRWSTTGSIQDEALFLLEQVRTGSCDAVRLRFAALLGHQASAVALREAAPTGQSLDATLGELCADVQVGVRTALAVLDLGLGLLRGSPWVIEGCRPAIEASRTWALCPCLAHAEQAREVASQGEARANAADTATTIRGDWWSYAMVRTAHFIPGAIALAIGLPEPCPEDPLGPEPAPLLLAVCREFSGLPSHVDRSEEQARRAVYDEVVPWLLGYSDPIRERVTARPE